MNLFYLPGNFIYLVYFKVVFKNCFSCILIQECDCASREVGEDRSEFVFLDARVFLACHPRFLLQRSYFRIPVLRHVRQQLCKLLHLFLD